MYRILIMALAMALFFAAPAHAQDAAKIGVVNLDKVIAGSEPGKEAKEEIQTKFSSEKDSLEKQKNDIQSMRDEMQKQSLVLSQEAKQDKEYEFKRMVRDFQDSFQMLQRKIKTEEDKLLEPIVQVIMTTVEKYGKDNGYTVIFDSKSSGLVYAQESVDLTKPITAEVNRAWRERSTSQ